MSSQNDQIEQPLVSVFNGYVGTLVIFALEEMGFFHLIQHKSYVELNDAAILGVEPQLLLGMCNTLQALGIIQRNNQGHYELTLAATPIIQQLGFFSWAVGGYGDILRNLYPLATGEKRFGHEVQRDARYVAKGAGQCTKNFVSPIISQILDEIPCQIVADFGCGSGELLIQLCHRYPNIQAVGVEISPNACELARKNIADAHLEERIEIVEADIRDPLRASNTKGVELLLQSDIIICLFMLHDLMQNKEQAPIMLSHIKSMFHQAKFFLFGDTMQTDSSVALQQSFFIVGFELVHAFMKQRIWQKQVYDEMFAATNFHIQHCVELAIPSSWLYLLSQDK